MNTPSAEQSAIVEYIRNGNNVLGDCVAGSGKTTSVLLVAAALRSKRILKVTYNKALKIEVRQKASALELTNLEIHTYNSLCVKYYDREGYNNETVRRAIERGAAPLVPLPEFDIIVLDETQDMNMIFYDLIRKFIKDCSKYRPLEQPIQLLILGDKYQSIYGFIGADSRFLTLGHELWDRPFVPATLSTSYRVTHEIASFVNDVMLGQDRIKATRSGPVVEYVYCDPYKSARKLCMRIIEAISRGDITPGDIFVLGPSIKGAKTPLRLLENKLVNAGLPCYYPVSDESQLDEEIIDGKVVFSTYHQSKGRERKLVIIYNFDASYFRLYNQSANPTVCPEPLYVAATRARTNLILLHSSREPALPFIQSPGEIASKAYVSVKYFQEPQGGQLGQLAQLAEPVQLTLLSMFSLPTPKAAAVPEERRHNASPTMLTAYLKESNITLLSAIIDQITHTETAPEYKVEIPSKITFEEGNCEDVSDINGIAIPAIYEARIHGTSTIERIVRQKFEELRDDETFLRDAYLRIGTDVRTPSAFLRLTIMYISFVERIYNKISQITHQTWLTSKMIIQCLEVLEKYISKDATFEEEIEYTTGEFPEFGKVLVRGRLDAFDKVTIYEIKCVDALVLEHKLELLVYAWIWKQAYEDKYGSREFKLLNVRTGEVCVLDARSSLLKEAMYILFQNKYAKTDPISDRQFIEKCLSTKRGAVSGAPAVARAAAASTSQSAQINVIKTSSIPLFVDD
jgi:hypothetical protein